MVHIHNQNFLFTFPNIIHCASVLKDKTDIFLCPGCGPKLSVLGIFMWKTEIFTHLQHSGEPSPCTYVSTKNYVLAIDLSAAFNTMPPQELAIDLSAAFNAFVKTHIDFSSG